MNIASQILQAIAREALAACDPARAVERAVWAGSGRLVISGHPIPLQRRGRLLVVAFGKAAPGMFAGLAGRIALAEGRRPVVALVVQPVGAGSAGAGSGGARMAGARSASARAQAPRGFRLVRLEAEHPVPGRRSFAAGRRALRILGRAGAGDDVIVLASGGGSALMAAPLAPIISPAEKIGLHKVLIASGMPIGAINTVRKHLSAVKGGRLAAAARRAKSQTTLVVSDVDPERFADVASGPSLPDRTTLRDLVEVIARYGIAPAVPPRVLEALRRGRIPETPKPRDPAFRRSRSEVVLSNRDLRNAAVRAGLARGLSAEAMPGEIVAPAEEAVEMVARAIETAPPGTRLLVMGGEVRTVPAGRGVGGRAQELALRLALRMSGLGSRPWGFLALGSDGIDGNSPAAGAFVDGTTLERARAARIDPAKAVRGSDSHAFFRRLQDAVVTGPTGTNVRDLYLLLTGEAGAVRRAAPPAVRPGPPDREPSPPG
jgi:glycerate-2-kinase